MASLGDRVLARWPQEKSWWYPGVIVGDSGGLEVQFDDGDRSKVTPDEVRPLQVALGTRLQCRWKGGDAYYPGKVAAVHGHALHIAYDDGDQEVTSVCMIRIDQADL